MDYNTAEQVREDLEFWYPEISCEESSEAIRISVYRRFENPQVREAVYSALQAGQRVTIALCIEDHIFSLAYTVALHQHLNSRQKDLTGEINFWVRMPEDADYIRLFMKSAEGDDSGIKFNFEPFGTIRDSCQLDRRQHPSRDTTLRSVTIVNA